MESPSDPEELIELIEQGELDSEQLQELVKAHAHDSCEACEQAYELTDCRNIVELVFDTYQNKLTQTDYDLIEKSWVYNGERSIDYADTYTLALHPLSSLDALKFGAEAFFYNQIAWEREGLPLEDEKATQTLSRVAVHPKVTEEIFLEWLATVHEIQSHDGHSEACETCQSKFRQLWGQ